MQETGLLIIGAFISEILDMVWHNVIFCFVLFFLADDKIGKALHYYTANDRVCSLMCKHQSHNLQVWVLNVIPVRCSWGKWVWPGLVLSPGAWTHDWSLESVVAPGAPCFPRGQYGVPLWLAWLHCAVSFSSDRQTGRKKQQHTNSWKCFFFFYTWHLPCTLCWSNLLTKYCLQSGGWGKLC